MHATNRIAACASGNDLSSSSSELADAMALSPARRESAALMITTMLIVAISPMMMFGQKVGDNARMLTLLGESMPTGMTTSTIASVKQRMVRPNIRLARALMTRQPCAVH